MKKKFITTTICIIVVLVMVYFLWGVISDFGNDPFALISEETLTGITIERTDTSEKVDLSERDIEVMLAVIKQVKFEKYNEDFDKRKTAESNLLVTLERKVLPDIQYYTMSYYADLKDPHNSIVRLICVDGKYYTPVSDNNWFLNMKLTAEYMFPDSRPKRLQENKGEL